jgi:hypothetical protein
MYGLWVRVEKGNNESDKGWGHFWDSIIHQISDVMSHRIIKICFRNMNMVFREVRPRVIGILRIHVSNFLYSSVPLLLFC